MNVSVKTSEYSEQCHAGADSFSVDPGGHLQVFVGAALVAAYARDCWESVQVEESK